MNPEYEFHSNSSIDFLDEPSRQPDLLFHFEIIFQVMWKTPNIFDMVFAVALK
jgi:hypothetical protein